MRRPPWQLWNEYVQGYAVSAHDKDSLAMTSRVSERCRGLRYSCEPKAIRRVEIRKNVSLDLFDILDAAVSFPCLELDGADKILIHVIAVDLVGT